MTPKKLADPSPPPPFLSQPRYLTLILLLAVALAYQPVWYAGFVWDDASHVTANPCIVGPLGLEQIWTTPAGSICPLVLTTFWLEHALGGLHPLPYHLVNVLQHAVCAILLWQVLRTLKVPGPWLGAALWALHPLQVESVAWISEMKNTQSCVFYLLTILFFLRGLHARPPHPQKSIPWSYLLCLLFAGLAITSKLSTVVLPAVLALGAWWMEGRWNWRHLPRLTPIIAMSLIATLRALWPQSSAPVANADLPGPESWPQRLALAGDDIAFYLDKLLWPHPLIAIYPRWQINPAQWTSYLPSLLALGLLLTLWLKRASWGRPYFFAYTYFLIVLSPFLGLIDQSFWRFSFVEDHLQYLAGMGPLALLGAGIVRLSDRILPRKRALPTGLCTVLLLLMGALSWQRAWIFTNELSLWTDTLAKNPASWLAANNLGVALFQLGQTSEALRQYEKALQIRSGYAEADKNLGVCFFQTGRIDEAIKHYENALKSQPNDAEAFNKLGMAYVQDDQPNTAIIEYQKAIAARPDYAEAHNNLGIVFFQNGQMNDAIQQYQTALDLNPRDAQAHNNLAVALVQLGKPEEAIPHYQKALEINPLYAEAFKNYGIALSRLGQIDDAIQQYEKALAVKPRYAEAYNNLGIAYFQKGQVNRAVSLFQKAVQIDPNYNNAQNNLDRAQALAAHTATPP
jgi:tetratricopeptide (TPR) repeat protein